MNTFSPIAFVPTVRDNKMYQACLLDNPHLQGLEFIPLYNENGKLTIPFRYNRFLNSFDLSRDVWLVFCHEDFELREDPRPLFQNLAPDALWGPIGARHRTWFGAISRWQTIGFIEEVSKAGDGLRTAGVPVPCGTKVETFDCQCLVIHSSLLRNHPSLRFDEALPWDLYVEDFCIAAYKKGICSRILPIRCRHHSIRLELPDSYHIALTYLNAKYPEDCFAGTCSWIGGDRLGRHVTGWARKLLPKAGSKG